MARIHPSISRNVIRNSRFDQAVILDAFARVSPGTNPGDPAFTREGYLTACFLSKYADPSEESKDLRATRAYEKLLETENRNRETRMRLVSKPGKISGTSTSSLLYEASRLIARILGDYSHAVFSTSDFSNGATTSRTRRNAAAVEKFDGNGDITLSAKPYFEALLSLTPSWKAQVYEQFWTHGKDPIRIVEGNVCFTVPKDDSIDRACSKEPDINMYLQKAIGDHIRRRLQSWGIDLNDQSINRDLARQGSMDGSLATLDLSSASDSVTWELCRQLLPPQWFDVMCDLRSPRGYINGAWHEWELMSTMGNGFTFELESLIFYALSVTSMRHFGHEGLVSVYGDDIIVPTPAAPQVIELLRYCGFLINEDKSFVDGDFRESCGGHYWRGQDVTPFYCRKPIDDLTRIIWFLNKLREWSNIGGICDPQYEEIYFQVLQSIPTKVRSYLKGGRDMGSVTELVTPDNTGYRLHAGTRVVRSQNGSGLTYWLNKSEQMPGCDLEVSSRFVATHAFSCRPMPKWYGSRYPQSGVPRFLRELG